LGEALARPFLRLGFSPNALTLLGLGLGLGACLLFVWNRNSVLFGTLILCLGFFDFLDGSLARLAGRVTKFGGYLDAVCDRIFELAAALAAAYVSGHWVLLFLLLGGSMLISYTKARAALEIPISNTEWPDLMERMERGVFFVAGLILWGIFPGRFAGQDLFFWTLVGLNLAVFATVMQRLWRAKRLMEQRG